MDNKTRENIILYISRLILAQADQAKKFSLSKVIVLINNREAIQTTQRAGRKRKQKQDTRSKRARQIDEISGEDKEIESSLLVRAVVRSIGGRTTAGSCYRGATRRSRGGARAVSTKRTRSNNKRVRFS
jgi:hypothetical protein